MVSVQHGSGAPACLAVFTAPSVRHREKAKVKHSQTGVGFLIVGVDPVSLGLPSNFFDQSAILDAVQKM